LNAFMQAKNPNPVAANPAAGLSFSDSLQAMMAMMTLNMNQAQMRADEWRQQQEHEEKAHRRRMDELRELKGGAVTQESGPNPQVEAMKVQLDFFKETIKENRELIKELTTAQKADTGGDDLRKEIMELTKQNLEIKNTELAQKFASLEARLGDAQRNTMNIKDLIAQANSAGANLHQGDATDLQIQNEHDYKMEELKIRTQEATAEREARRAEAEAKAAEAYRQTELLKTIATEVGKAVVQSKIGPVKDLNSSSPGVKAIVGAMK
jgi:chromosome segregation ATPase